MRDWALERIDIHERPSSCLFLGSPFLARDLAVGTEDFL